jgi:hypothetical protein
MAEQVAIAGTAQDCARGVMRLAAAGASSVVVLPIGEDADEQLERLSSDVLPLVIAATVASLDRRTSLLRRPGGGTLP